MQFQEQEGQEPAQHTALGPYPRLRRTAMWPDTYQLLAIVKMLEHFHKYL
jgi:hypothetical protein